METEWKAGIILPMLFFVKDFRMWNHLGRMLETQAGSVEDIPGQIASASLASRVYPALFEKVRPRND